MPVKTRLVTTGLNVYVLFDDASNTAVDMAAGSGVQATLYEATDAAIVTAGLAAGTYIASVFQGDEGVPTVDDKFYGSREFRWDGTNELPLLDSTLMAAVLANASNYFDVDGKTVQQALRYMAATTAGKVSGSGSGINLFKGLDGTTDRVRAIIDPVGNRTSLEYDP